MKFPVAAVLFSGWQSLVLNLDAKVYSVWSNEIQYLTLLEQSDLRNEHMQTKYEF